MLHKGIISRVLLAAALLMLPLAGGTTRAGDCPGGPHPGAWDFVAGKMSVGGKFTPMGGGAVKARIDIPACGGNIEAHINTVGAITFQPAGEGRFTAVKLPPGFSPGIHWDLEVRSPTELSSTVYFKEPTEHLQAHRWTYAGAPVPVPEPPPEPPPVPPDDLGLEQGLWGHIPADLLLGQFLVNPADGGASPVFCLPPAADGLYVMPAEPDESGWFCLVESPCREGRLSSECVEWVAERGLKYCGFGEAGWDC